MNKITINDTDFFRTEIAYKTSDLIGKKPLVIYSESPTNVDSMINSLIRYHAEKLAEEKLKALITKKVSEFLNL